MLNLHWTYSTDSDIWATPVLTDLDGRGLNSIIFSNRAGEVHAINGQDGTRRWLFKTESEITGSLTAVDINGDGLPEVFFGSHDGCLRVVNANGESIWSFQAQGVIRSKPLVCRLPGEDEWVVIFADYHNLVYALNGSHGTLRWRQWLRYHPFVAYSQGIVSSPAIADLDQDGRLEVVIGTRNKRIFALDAATGQIKWFRRVSYGLDSSPSVAWINGYPVIFIGSGESLNGLGDNSIYAFDGATGRTLWRQRTKGGLDSSPSIGDINGDGQLEVVEATLADASLYAWNAEEGTLLWRYRIEPTNQCRHNDDNICIPLDRNDYFTQAAICRSYSTPVFVDLNRDGRLEVVFGSNNGFLYVLDGNTGHELFRFQMDGIVHASPVMADLDGDGRLELVVCGGNRVFVFETDATGPGWPMFKRDLQNRGNSSAPSAVEPSSSCSHGSIRGETWGNLWLALSVYGIDTLEYFIYKFEKSFLRPFGLRLLKYIY